MRSSGKALQYVLSAATMLRTQAAAVAHAGRCPAEQSKDVTAAEHMQPAQQGHLTCDMMRYPFAQGASLVRRLSNCIATAT